MSRKQPFSHHHLTVSLVGHSKRSFPFVPGILLMALALVVVFAPRLLLGALALILFIFGAFLCFLAWKFMQFKRHLTRLSKELEGKFQVQAFHVHDGEAQNSDIEVEPGEPEGKKVVFH